MNFLPYLIGALLMGYLLYSIARVRGANKWYWAKWGVLLGPLVLPFVFFSRPVPQQEEREGPVEGRPRRVCRRFAYVFWHTAGVLVLLVCVFGVLFAMGVFVPTRVLSGSELSDDMVAFLRENELLGDDETVFHFYSDGLFSSKEDGSFFTDRGIVSYWWDYSEGALSSIVAPYCTVEGLSVTDEDGSWGGSVIAVQCQDKFSFDLFVSNEAGLDRTFYEKLREQWIEKRDEIQDEDCELILCE